MIEIIDLNGAILKSNAQNCVCYRLRFLINFLILLDYLIVIITKIKYFYARDLFLYSINQLK